MCLCEEGRERERERGRKTKKERNEKEVNINKFICKHTHTHRQTQNKHLEDTCMQSRNYSCVRARMQTDPKTMTQCMNDKTCVQYATQYTTGDCEYIHETTYDGHQMYNRIK